MKTRLAMTLAAALVAAAGSLASAQQPGTAAPAFAAANLSEQGARALAANCASCHGTNGRTAPGSTVAALAGRPREELVVLMAQFRDGTRPATIMHQIAKSYGDAEVAAIADYFARQPR